METWPANQPIFGRTGQQWIVDWWNHRYTDSRMYMLIADYDFELPDVLEISKEVECIMLSPINFIYVDEDRTNNWQVMMKQAVAEIDIVDPKQIKVQFDGTEVGHLAERILTKIFRTRNGWAISDGYWLFLKGPFSEGKHKITTFGTCRSGEIQLNRVMDLNVVDVVIE